MRTTMSLALALALAGCSSPADVCQPAQTSCGQASWRACASGSGSRCWIATSSGQTFNCNSCADCVSATQQATQWCQQQGGVSGGGSGGAGGGGGAGGFGGGGGPAPDMATAIYLDDGNYVVSDTVVKQNDCQLTLPATLPVVNNSFSLAIGNQYDSTTTPMFNPPGYGIGSGGYTTMTSATLTTSTTETLSDGCSFARSDSAYVVVAATNFLLVEWQHTETNYSALCSAQEVPQPSGCTTAMTFDLRF
jgi:hypothetical protein